MAISACGRQGPPSTAIDTAPATRQDILVNVEATGVIEPVDAVQVKSKASGQIVKMPIVVGSQVQPNELLVQVDPTQMQSQHAAAVAALTAARSSLEAQRLQMVREDSLFRQRAITAQEHETAVVNYANAQSAVAAAENAVVVDSINLADATVLAPIAGTIIDKSVSLGQVIASATNVVGGGTTLVTVADLGHVLDSALVNESDIGRVKIDQDVSVTVDAYPNRTFRGRVMRISPQAIVQQSVTMFPVLVSLDNRQRLLLPGMTSDATIDVMSLVGVITVPNDAIGSLQELGTLGASLKAPASTIDSIRRLAGGALGAQTGRAAKGAGTPRIGQAAGEVALGTANAAPRPGIVFVQDTTSKRFMPRFVTLGGGNYDVTQVLSGLSEGERVALLSDVRVAASRDTTLQRIQGRSGIGGMTGGGGARGQGGGGGARSSGR